MAYLHCSSEQILCQPRKAPPGGTLLASSKNRRTRLHTSIRERTSMSGLRPLLRRADLSGFFARVGKARRRALLLDYDGTLAPLSADRAHAVPYPGIRAALVTISLARKPTA